MGIKNTTQQEIISVCICTYKRPEMLSRLLDGVLAQITNELFLFEIVIVDNDKTRSAESIVKNFQNATQFKINFDCEPEQNIAMARNRAVKNTGGDYVAFIDDDEVPVKDWLVRLYNTIKDTCADGVLGPVLPYYPEGAPKWLDKCKLFDRRRFNTGAILTESRDTRTGNVLLARYLFCDGELWFDHVFGLTGGEDVNFFGRKLSEGKKFVWCDEAVAYETIPPERWKSSYYIKRYFRSGTINGERKGGNIVLVFFKFMKYAIAIPLWIFFFICYLPLGKHRWFQPLLKLAYFSGSILAFCGISLLRER